MFHPHRQAETDRSPVWRTWHNPLPGWILDHPKFATLKGGARLLLQTIADSCDPAAREHELGAGTLCGAFGSLGTFAQRIGASTRNVTNTGRLFKKLIALGFVVRTLRGGTMRVEERVGTLTIASSYAIPGEAEQSDGVACVTAPPKCADPPAKMCTHHLWLKTMVKTPLVLLVFLPNTRPGNGDGFECIQNYSRIPRG